MSRSRSGPLVRAGRPPRGGSPVGKEDGLKRRHFRRGAAAVALVAASAFAIGACGGGGGPRAGVAPRGAASADAGVTNGAISYTTRNLVAMLADRPTQAARQNAASRAARAIAG